MITKQKYNLTQFNQKLLDDIINDMLAMTDNPDIKIISYNEEKDLITVQIQEKSESIPANK